MTDEQIFELAFKHCYATTAANGFIFTRDRGHMIDFARAVERETLDRVALMFDALGKDLAASQVRALADDDTCGNCNGTGRMVRDPDIGTDQECFACDGTGRFKD